MKRFIQLAAFVLALAASISPVNAIEAKCSGDAARSTPPIPNYPTHIRNVVWRNRRAQCQHQASSTNFSKAKSSGTEAAIAPAIAPISNNYGCRHKA